MYNVLQCPMEVIHGRPSLIHNVIAAGTLGYIGVATHRLGVPLVNPYQVAGGRLSPPAVAFLVYGGIAGGLAGLQGKPI